MISRLSLRVRILLIAIGLLATGLAIGSTAMIDSLERYLVGRVDAQLRMGAEDAGTTARAVRRGGGEVRLPPTTFAFGGGVSFITQLGPDGAELHASTGGAAITSVPDLRAIPVTGKPTSVPSGNGTDTWRIVAMRSGEYTIVAATSMREIEDTVGHLRMISLAGGGALLVALTLAGWFAIRAGLRPLRQIEETSAAIAGGDLSSRVPDLAAPGTEIGRVASALNGMLGQNEAAFAARAESEARMRRFVADASHELRTPLAGIKGFTKLRRMGALPDDTDAMERIERESDRLERLVEDLLLLARLDEEPALQLAPTDLRTLAADALHDVRALDPTRPATLTGPGGGQPVAAPTMADEARLRQVVTNLVGNAVKHTPSGTSVRIGVGSVGEHAVLEVADDGPGLSREQATRVFDRFYRADDSRTRAAGGGAGLGLAIVSSLVEAHRGRIELRTAPGRGAVFRVLLPLFTDPTDS